MTLCHDAGVPPALVHPSHDMRRAIVPAGSLSCADCLAYRCPACGPDEAEDEALAAECAGRGWWDGLESAGTPRRAPAGVPG